MKNDASKYDLRLARSKADIILIQRLRYEIFIAELGGDGPMVDHENRLERDAFDTYFDHLMLIDKTQQPGSENSVIGVYRLLRCDQAAKAGGFYSEAEYDLSKLENSGRKLLELGRSCVRKDYRGSAAMYHLWNGLGAYVAEHGIELLFGVASFHGTDVAEIRAPLAYLHHNHLAPENLRVRAHQTHFQSMNLMAADQIYSRAALRQLPSLIKAYLRMGGRVGEGAFIDHNFNTTDVLIMMDTDKISDRQRNLYTKGRNL